MLDVTIWDKLDCKIKSMIFKNGLTPELIKSSVVGELNEMVIKISDTCFEVLFYGNGEAHIDVDVDGVDYSFVYVVDNYGNGPKLVNY